MFQMALALLLSSFISLHAQSDTDAPVSGYVTRVASASDYDVDGVRVVLRPDTSIFFSHGSQTSLVKDLYPFLGQPSSVWGKLDQHSHTISSTRLLFSDPPLAKVAGSAIIDLIPASSPPRARADGRILDLSPLAASGGASSQNLRTNVWIDYRGVQQADGVVLVDQAIFATNGVGKSEQKLHKREEYDPAAVPEGTHQSSASHFFKGFDPKQLAPYSDIVMQARIDRVGRSLIPVFQRDLPASDPTRIDFRFQLVDRPKWHDAITLANGIILVPYQIVQRLPDDSELASILSDNIATALEKQTFRQQPTNTKLSIAEVGGSVAGILIPGAGVATSLAAYGAGKHMLTRAEQQSGRVALSLMHDAGYDLAKAPEAWWILATKQGEDPHRSSPPPRAVNQYEELALTWRSAAPAALRGEGR